MNVSADFVASTSLADGTICFVQRESGSLRRYSSEGGEVRGACAIMFVVYATPQQDGHHQYFLVVEEFDGVEEEFDGVEGESNEVDEEFHGLES